MKFANVVALLTSTAVSLAGCSSFRSATSPDVIYDESASSARTLQVPPDLTDVSNLEQFVLPGTSNAPATRNTLLPEFKNVRFVRSGAQSWLAFEQTPEDIWPLLLAFIRAEKYVVDQTEPVAGTITTQWRPNSAVDTGKLLKNLIGDNEAFTRVAFRLERDGDKARLFARSQAASSESAIAKIADSDWPAQSHAPEATSALLAKLLVFFGIEEQKALGILDGKQARAILGNTLVQTTGAGGQLVIYKGFQSSFSAVLSALNSLKYPIISRDDGLGRIEFSDKNAPLVIELSPVHVSEVRLSVSDADGRRLPRDKEQLLLNSLHDHLV